MADDKLPANDGRPAVDGGAHGPSPASFAGAGVQFVLSILLFLYLGKWLDAKFGTAPWLLMAGVFVGAAGGFYSFYAKIMASSRGNGSK